MQEDMKFSEMSLDELQHAQTRVLVAKAAFIDFIKANPPIDWHDSKFGPIAIKAEGRRVTEDPMEDDLRLEAFDEQLALIAGEIGRRLGDETAHPNEDGFSDAELADQFVRMHQIDTRNKTSGDPLPQIKATAEVLHDSGLIDDDEHARFVSALAQDLNEESLVQALADVGQMKEDQKALESKPEFGGKK